jgi:dGTPase
VNVGDERFRREKRKREYRTEFQIDRDRVLYSPHLARLAEVTQVRASGEGFLVHNRLTHSLKVAQLARRIAEKLVKVQEDLSGHVGLDPDAAEAAGLAHDMGHPPFGHIAEKELDSLVRDRGVSDGYEGNAQTFRIVARLSVGDSSSQENDVDVPGLNLTARTINGLLRYPWSFKDSRPCRFLLCGKNPSASSRRFVSWKHARRPRTRSVLGGGIPTKSKAGRAAN